MANRMTYVQAIEEAIEALGRVDGVNGEVAIRLNDLKVSLVTRAASKSKKRVEANTDLKATIKQALAQVGKPATPTQILATGLLGAEVSNQKVTAMLAQMVEANEIERTIDKKRAYYALI